MKIWALFVVILAWCAASVSAQILTEDFSSGTIDSSTWGYYDTPDGEISVDNMDFGKGADYALTYAAHISLDDYTEWGFYSLDSFARESGGDPLYVTFDFYQSGQNFAYIGWVAANGAYDFTQIKHLIHPSGGNAYCLTWDSFRQLWSPGISLGFDDVNTWMRYRLVLKNPTGAIFEIHDGSDWVVLHDTDSGDDSTHFHFGIVLAPQVADEFAVFDNIAIGYVGQDQDEDEDEKDVTLSRTWYLYD